MHIAKETSQPGWTCPAPFLAKSATSVMPPGTARWPRSTSRSPRGRTSLRCSKVSPETDATPCTWGYIITGHVVVTYAGGGQERCTGGDLFYWPPGHTVRIDHDAEVIIFSPQSEHDDVSTT